MKLLLDTCTALWLFQGSDRLSARVLAALAAPETELLFHQASYLEITLKYNNGALRLSEPPSHLIPRALQAYRIRFLSLANVDIAGLEKLPAIHSDPFDRLLISAALHQGALLATPDPVIHRYDLSVLW